jgi:tight adherence protein C
VVRKSRSALILAGFDGNEQLALYLITRILTPVLLVSAAMAFGAAHARWRGIAIVGSAVVGYLLPDYVLGKLTQRRKRKILHELPVIIELLVVTLEAGMGLMEAVRIVGRETSRQGMVLAKELSTAAAARAAGPARDDDHHPRPGAYADLRIADGCVSSLASLRGPAKLAAGG